MKRLTLVSIGINTTLFAIGCDRPPTNVSSPRFLLVPGNGTWTTKASMAAGERGGDAGVISGRLYVAAGGLANNCGQSQTLEVYDPATDTWTIGAPRPTARSSLAAGVVNGVLYVVGGQGPGCPGARLNTVEAFDPVTNSWTTKASMPTARDALAAAVVNGVLYAVGGSDGSSVLGTVEAYDPLGNTWTTKAPMPTARTSMTAVVVNGVLYAIGGDDGFSLLATVEAFDPVANTWTTRAPLPIAVHEATSVVMDGMVYVAGGSNATSIPNALQRYDPTGDVWTSATPMPTARFHPAGGVINNTFYVVGGGNCCDGFLATNEAFTTHVFPTATFTFPGSVVVGSAIPLSLTNAQVPGHPEATTFTFAFDCGDGAGYSAFGTSNAASCPTSAVGTRTVGGTVQDQDGDTQQYTASVSIVYNFSGFVAPVDNPPIVNVAKAGSAIPVKFTLHGNQGLNILAAGSPTSRAILCDTGAPQDAVEQTVTAGSSSLSYDPATDLYTYVWKTDKTWAGSCRELTITLNDNSVHQASFRFTK